MTGDDIIMEEGINLVDNDEGMSMDEFNRAGNYINAPSLNQEMVFNILKVNKGPLRTVKTKDGRELVFGLKNKEGKGFELLIDTDIGQYSVNHWEIYYNFFGNAKLGLKSLFEEYNKKHNKKPSDPIKGMKISIKRIVDGSHATIKLSDLSKILGVSMDEAKAYQEKVVKAKSEFKMFEVKLLN